MIGRSALFVWVVLALGCGGPSPAPDAGPEPDAGATDASAAPDATHPDAGPTPEACSEPGAMRTVSCGSCGIASERCEGGLWARVSECLDEGECAPGAIEMESTAMCGERTRICDDDCAWRDWTQTMPDADCGPGDTRRTSEGCTEGEQIETCSESCEWVGDGLCTDACGGIPRTSPLEAQEVCVSAGPFIRGDTLLGFAEPVREITLSAFYIDRFPVSNARYLACMTAGVCTNVLAAWQPWMTDPARARHPVQGVTREQAVAFCSWDGGRVLPTEAQWEKAARGPAPAAPDYVWGTDVYPNCAALQTGDCGFTDTSRAIPDAVDALPGTRSYYGTEMQIGGGFEHVYDVWSEDYYATSPSTDPTGPPGTVGHVMRGVPRANSGSTNFHVSLRGYEGSNPENTIRCARPAPGTE